MTDEKFHARLVAVGNAANLHPKPEALETVSALMRQQLDDDAASAALVHALKDLRMSRPHLFQSSERASTDGVPL